VDQLEKVLDRHPKFAVLVDLLVQNGMEYWFK
jgi:hypothetical protein